MDVKHAPEADNIRRNIAAGKQCTRLAMTWNNKISFVLTEHLAIKGIKPLDVIKENDTSTRNDEERFDNDMMLMTGELSKMLGDAMSWKRWAGWLRLNTERSPSSDFTMFARKNEQYTFTISYR